MSLSNVPFAEPPWLAGFPSPIHTASHRQFQKRCREFIGEHLYPYALEWDQAENVPSHVWDTFNKTNMLVPNLPAPLPVEWLRRLGIHDILGTPVDEWDYIHTGIYIHEMSRSGLAGPPGSLSAGFAYGIPCVIKYGSKALQEEFLPDALSGKTRWCIAITEPDAGSDVAGIQTTATLSNDGKHFIINGIKKWITNGIWSDYAAMAVRTGGTGAAGISLIVCPLKGHKGVSMRRLKVGGQVTGGTTLILLEDVKVPASNLIGSAGNGMRYIMRNFNHERLTIAVGVCSQSRVALSMAFKYTSDREAFGKPLMDQAVVRHRLAKAGSDLEALSAHVDWVLWQLTKLSKDEADTKLGGLTAMLKAQSGRVFAQCAETAMLLFGGNGYTRSGVGELIERIYREVPGSRIPGGSEDVLYDLGVRQLYKNYKNATKQLERPKDGASKL